MDRKAKAGFTLGRYAKLVIAVIGAAAVAAQVALGDGVLTDQEWVTVIVAGLAALGVGAVPNLEHPKGE